MRILDACEAPSDRDELHNYGETEIQFLADFYGKSKKNKLDILCKPILDGEKLITEWRMVRNILCDYKDFTFIEAWQRIWTNNPNFNQQFPQLSKLAEIAIIVPISNGVVERVFSQQNLIKTKLRNLMSIETLNYHLHMTLNAPISFMTYDFEKAYEYWNGIPRYNH